MAGLDGVCLYVHGRLHGVTRRRLAECVAAAGGRLVPRPGPRVDLVALGHGTALTMLIEAPPPELPEGLTQGVALVSELTLKRRLGLAPELAPQPRLLDAAELIRLTGLDERRLACLALYDVLEPADGRYGYRDLVAAREVARLLAAGLYLDEIVETAVALRRRGLGLSQVRLAEGPSGEILREIGGCLAGLDGQYRLPFDEPFESVEEVFARAEAFEEAEHFVMAERWYRTALYMDPTDPVIAFNLGNVLDRQGRATEAAMAWRLALDRAPDFAEAWFNLGVAAEQAERFEEATADYGRALRARPDFGDAAYNLALLLYLRGRFAEAVPAWERFLSLEPTSREAELARRYAALCRLQARRPHASTGSERDAEAPIESA